VDLLNVSRITVETIQIQPELALLIYSLAFGAGIISFKATGSALISMIIYCCAMVLQMCFIYNLANI
tara:strand:+ start:411 stop:611 length:201 start_codon:yes stop_codon:yes gene_type:complete